MAELKQEKFQKPNEESFGKREEVKIRESDEKKEEE